jgi:type I restriction enzyme R subunit
VRKQLTKIKTPRPQLDLDHAVRDLVDDSIESEGVVDIFAAAGIERADISILDDEFLQTFKDKPLLNLRLQLLEQLVRDELKRREKHNLAQAKSFQELLENTLQRYHNRLIDAATVIQAMIEIRKSLETQDQRAQELGLEEEELAFYDAIAEAVGDVYDHPFLRGLVHDVVQTIKQNLKVDWTEPHREDVRAGVRLAVKRVLARRGIQAEDFDKVVLFVMKQAEEVWRDWGAVA